MEEEIAHDGLGGEFVVYHAPGHVFQNGIMHPEQFLVGTVIPRPETIDELFLPDVHLEAEHYFPVTPKRRANIAITISMLQK